MTVPEKTLIRKANVNDVPKIAEIVNKQAETGMMLPRPLSRLYDNVRDFSVIIADGEIAGCGSLHVMWSDLAEICAVTIREAYRGKGLGRALVGALIDDAETVGVERVFVLTYQVDFFRKLGFSDVDKSELPHKIWNDCINCVHFPDCDEIALIRSVL
ncbi:N-acetyltransferase [Candidatus Latescibacterota bacterium]